MVWGLTIISCWFEYWLLQLLLSSYLQQRVATNDDGAQLFNVPVAAYGKNHFLFLCKMSDSGYVAENTLIKIKYPVKG